MSRFYEDMIRHIEQEFERSDDLLRRISVLPGSDCFWEPQADVYETRLAVVVKLDLAGVRPASIQVELAGDCRYVAVRGIRDGDESSDDERIMFHQMEIYLGPFERAIPLPAGCEVCRDEVSANYRNGFLVINLPKRAPAGPTQIPIKS